MDTCSSGEEVIIKTRKPYTITKQRERWTEVEHNRFLEALKLYGRAWQRIEEHMGTKTAVQIRSHAQKFFTKLEKEALVKGIPIGQAIDIEIPPPRPKRKPSNPYPRKITSCPTSRMESKDEKSAHPTSLSQAEHIIDLEKEPLPAKMEDENFGNGKENQDGNKYPKKYIIVQGSPGTSPSANKSAPPKSIAPAKSCVFKEFVPVLNEVANMDESNESHITVEQGVNQIFDEFGTMQSFEENGAHNGENLTNSHHLEEKLAQSKGNELEQYEKFENMRKNDWQSMQTPARHVAVQILDGSLRINAPNVFQDMSYEEPMFHKSGGVEPNALTNLSSSGTSEHHSSASRFSINQPFTGFHPIFTPVQNQENYLSLLHASTFSNLIVSALLQNPAAHTAGSFAASFWPCPRIDVPAESSAGTAGGFSAGQMNGTPSVAAIAAATVAAATAWWASRGLLPLCAPFHMGFNYVPASTSTVPPFTNEARADRMDRREETIHPALDAQTLESEFSKDLQEQHSTSKSPSLPPSVCEERKGLKSGNGLPPKENEQAVAVAEVHDSRKPKARKPIDRSSCGSNTPSSSEVETDALDKHGKGKEELREPAVNPIDDANGRRSRSSSSTSDSWKEVSEEGRLAFRALFSRDVLPQSFSPPHGSKNKGNSSNDEDEQNGKEKSNEEPQLDMTAKTCANSTTNQEVENDSVLRSWGLLTLGKLKVRRTGFKPYKRCLVEAKESSRLVTAGSEEEEKGTKRIRLEGGAFTH